MCVLSWAAAMAMFYDNCPSAAAAAAAVDNATSAAAPSCVGGNMTCWEGYTEQPYIFIISVPMGMALAVRNKPWKGQLYSFLTVF